MKCKHDWIEVIFFSGHKEDTQAICSKCGKTRTLIYDTYYYGEDDWTHYYKRKIRKTK